MKVSSVSTVSCPVCDARETTVFLEEQDHGLVSGDIGSCRRDVSPGRILRCHSCGFAFRQMRSSPEQLRELYRQMDPTAYESEFEGRNRTALKHLQIVRRFATSGRLLDVGCASGLFLSHALRAGFEVAGVEPNEKLCAEARRTLHEKGEIYCADLESAHLDSGFLVITLWDVLEHVPDPRDFLRKCRDLLHSNGFLFLNVPDLDSFEARILGRRWPLFLPEHLNYFNKKSLQLCATQVRLRPVKLGRRRAWFSTKYVAGRMAQHRIPGAGLALKAFDSAFGRILVPISLGEIYSVWTPT